MIIDEIDNNQYSLFKHISLSNGLLFEERKNYSFTMNDKNVWNNFIFDLKSVDGNVIFDIASSIERKLIPGNLVGALNHPGFGEEEDIILKYFASAFETDGMMLTREYFNYKSLDSNLVISECHSGKDFLEWTNIVITYLFNNYSEKNAMDFGEMIRVACGNKKLTAYLGSYNNEPVAASSCFIENNTGGIYFVAVPDKFRGRGFGCEITAKCILEGMTQGVDNYILHASALGKPVYQKLGFKTAGIKKRFVYKGLLKNNRIRDDL